MKIRALTGLQRFRMAASQTEKTQSATRLQPHSINFELLNVTVNPVTKKFKSSRTVTLNFQCKAPPAKHASTSELTPVAISPLQPKRAQSVASRRAPIDRTVIESQSAQIIQDLKRHTLEAPYKGNNNKTLRQRIELSIIRNRTPSRGASGLASLSDLKPMPFKHLQRTGIDSNDTLSEGALNQSKYYKQFVEEYQERTPANQIEINFTQMLQSGASVHQDQGHFMSAPSNVNESVTEAGFPEKRLSRVNNNTYVVPCANPSISAVIENSREVTPLENLDRFKQTSDSPIGPDSVPTPLPNTYESTPPPILEDRKPSSAGLEAVVANEKQSTKSLFHKESLQKAEGKENAEVKLSPGGSRVTVLQKKKVRVPVSPMEGTPKALMMSRLIPPPGGIVLRPNSGKTRLMSSAASTTKKGSPLQPKHVLELRRLQPVVPPPPKMQTPLRSTGSMVRMLDAQIQMSNKAILPEKAASAVLSPTQQKRKKKKKRKLHRPSSSPEHLYHSPTTGRMQAYLRIPTPSTTGPFQVNQTEEDDSPQKIQPIYSNIYEQQSHEIPLLNDDPTTNRSLELRSQLPQHNESIVLTDITGYDMLDESKYSKVPQERRIITSKPIRVEDDTTPLHPISQQESVQSVLQSEQDLLPQAVTLHQVTLERLKPSEQGDTQHGLSEFVNAHISRDSVHSVRKARRVKVRTPPSRSRKQATGSSPGTFRHSHSPKWQESGIPADISKEESSISSTLMIKGIQPRYLKRSTPNRQSGAASVEPGMYDREHEFYLDELDLFTRRASVQSSRLPSRKQSIPHHQSLLVTGLPFLRESIAQRFLRQSSPERALEEEAISASKILLRETQANLNYTSIHEYESRDGHSETENTNRLLAEPIRVEFRPSTTFQLTHNQSALTPSNERPLLTIRRLSPRKPNQRQVQSQSSVAQNPPVNNMFTEHDQDLPVGFLKEIYSKTAHGSQKSGVSRESSIQSPPHRGMPMMAAGYMGSFSAISGGPKFNALQNQVTLDSKSTSRTASFNFLLQNVQHQEAQKSSPTLHLRSTEEKHGSSDMRHDLSATFRHQRPATVCKGYIPRRDFSPVPSLMNQSRLSLPDQIYYKKGVSQPRTTILSGRPATGIEEVEVHGLEETSRILHPKKASISKQLGTSIRKMDYHSEVQRAKRPTLWSMMTRGIGQRANVAVGSPMAAVQVKTGRRKSMHRERPVISNVKRIKRGCVFRDAQFQKD